MKKIFVYIGSRAGKESSTFKYIYEVLNKTIESVGKDKVNIDLYMPSNCKINSCMSCNKCFFYGRCPQDKNDDMEIIKSKMIKADFIILASPVYLHNVSGDMKIFIDRIAYWSHLLRLAGKVGIAVVTSTGNGLDLTANYIHKVMTYMGIKVVGKFGVIPYDNNKDIINSIESCSNIIKDYINGKNVESDNILEKLFTANKISIEAQSELNTAEYRYWNESGLIKCNSFEEVLDTLI